MSDVNPEVKTDETANFVTTLSDYPEPQTEAEAAKPEEQANSEGGEAESAGIESTDNVSDSDSGTEAKLNDGEKSTANNDAPKKSNKVQKRINKLTREREEANRKREALEKENAELKGRLEKPAEQELKEPVQEDFESYDEYLDAVDSYETAITAESKPEKPSASEERSTDTDKPGELTDSQKTAMAVLKEFVSEADKPDDFEAVALAEDVPITGDMLEALAECEDPVKVMYHLGNNKDVAAEIASASPSQQMRAITKLDLSVEAKPAKPVQQSKAPDPIAPVGAGGDTGKKPISEMSFKEYEAHQNKIERGR